MAPAPMTNHALRVSDASTIGAHTNSSVNANDAAATIAETEWTGTPTRARLLPSASPTTPVGHARHTCRKKNANGGAFFVTGDGISARAANGGIRIHALPARGDWPVRRCHPRSSARRSEECGAQRCRDVPRAAIQSTLEDWYPESREGCYLLPALMVRQARHEGLVLSMMGLILSLSKDGTRVTCRRWQTPVSKRRRA